MLRASLAIAAFFLLASCAQTTAIPKAVFGPDAVIPFTRSEDSGEALTIATYNVEGFDLGGTAPRTCVGIIQALKNASVEVVAFEEVQSDDISFLTAALRAENSPLTYTRCSTMSDGNNALAVASAYPILQAEEILLPKVNPSTDKKEWPRTVFKVRVDIGKGLTLFICHLKSGPDSAALSERKRQASALSNYIRETYRASISTETLVVLGDMNTMSEGDRSGTAPTLTSLELRDDSDAANDFKSMTEMLLSSSGDSYTWEGSVAGTWTRSSLDHILLSPAAQARFVPGSLKIYRSDPTVSMIANSDHYPVVLDIKL